LTRDLKIVVWRRSIAFSNTILPQHEPALVSYHKGAELTRNRIGQGW
jgi:hypothetical protein